MSDATPAQLLAVAVDVARKAGDLLTDQRPAGQISTGAKSSPTDLVTVMDTAAERLIVDMLRAKRPHDAIVGEEGGERPGDSSVRWLVDPLDGTVNYSYQLPHWSVSVAAVIADETVAGVVIDPSAGETWTATRGGGARCNGSVIRCSDESDLSQAMVATGFAYVADVRAQQAEVLRTVLPRVRDIRRFGSCAVDLCWTAAGRYDGYYERGPRAWDYAAGSLIAREAGATFAVLPPCAAIDFPLILAAAPELFDGLRALVDPGPGH